MKNKNKIGSVAEVAGMAAIAGVEIGMALRDKKTEKK